MKWLFRTSAFIVILFASCIGSFVLNVAFRWLSSQNRDCTTQSVVYQGIKAKVDDWNIQFVDQSLPTTQSINFLNTDARSYYAEIYRDTSSATPALLYVLVGTDRAGSYGESGFFYLFPDQVIPGVWFEQYWITQLDDNIYCYQLRGF